VALAAVAELRNQGWCVSTDAMREGLATAKLPGRVEVFSGNPTVIVDTAHNPPSARALAAALAELAPAARKTLILAVSRDKDVRAIVRELVPHFDRVIATQYQLNPRALDASELAEIIEHEGFTTVPVARCATPGEAWDLVRHAAACEELVVIAGSFFLAAELRAAVVASQEAAIFASSRQDAGTM
jgi:dihydrofolate synthase / folylpolyglutamate synthase